MDEWTLSVMAESRRGRAASVCALSPGGFWTDELRARVASKLDRDYAIARFPRPLVPLLVKPSALRWRVLRDLPFHGDRVSAARHHRLGRARHRGSS